MNKKLKIKHYVSIIAVLALIPTLLLGTILTYDLIKKGQTLKNQHIMLAAQISNEIRSYFGQHIAALNTLATQMREIGVSSPELKEILTTVAEHFPGFSEVYLSSINYQISSKIPSVDEEYKTDKTKLLFDHISAAHFISLGQPYISPLVRGPRGEETVFIAIPLLGREGSYNGYIMGSLNLYRLHSSLEKYKIYPSGYTVLVDHTGNIIGHPAREYDDDAMLIVTEVLKEKKNGSWEYYSPGHERQEIAGFQTIPDYQWGVWVAASQNEVLMPLYNATLLSLVLITLSVLMIVIIRHLLVSNILLPLTSLDKTCQEFSSGNLAYRVKLNEGANLPVEILTLGDKFNEMASRMQLSNNLLKIQSDELEKRVRERTYELVLRNKELSALYAVASSLSSTNDLMKILGNVLEEIMSLFSLEVSAILIVKGDGEKLEKTIWRKEYPDTVSSRYEEYLKVIGANVIRVGFPEVIPLLSRETAPAKDDLPGLKSLLSVPIHYKNTILGAITLASSRSNCYGRQELLMLQAICNQVGVMISNVSLFNQTTEGHNTLLAIINSMNEGLILFNAKAKIIYANPVFSEMFDMGNRNWYGLSFQNMKEYLLAHGYKLPYDDLQDDFKNVRVFQQREAKYFHRDKINYCLIIGFPVLAEEEFIGYGYIFRNITREKQIDSLKNSILSTVSHELRTPLTIIRGNAESLLRKGVNWEAGEKEDFLKTIVNESNHLRELIENIMDMSKIEAGALNLDIHSSDIKKVIKKVVAQSAQCFPAANFVIENQARLPFVIIDERRIEQVLRNLVENAVKYSKSEPRIKIATKHLKEENKVQVSVIDSGIGIEPQYYEAIFERFYRVDNSMTKKIGGSGVGLSIAKGIIDAHGGRIWFESVYGQGSRFHFTIPCEII